MSLARAALALAVVSAAAAAVLALVSRAPGELRRSRPDDAAVSAERGAAFTRREIARGRAYRNPSYLAWVLGIVVEAVVLLLLAAGPWRGIVGASDSLPGGWPVRAAVLGALAALVLSVASLPLAFVRGYAMEHAWGLSTQTAWGWASDRARDAFVTMAVSGIAAVAFFGIVRARPGSWWIWGAAAFSALSALLAFVWPVVVAPLFNEFTPLRDQALAADARSLARAAGVDVEDVLVADASRRTHAENAYVAGLATTRRLVLYDNLLASGRRQTLFVVAHELGHEAEKHVLKHVAIGCAALFAGFGALALAVRSAPGALRWAGAAGVGDMRAIPLLALFATLGALLFMPVHNAMSRSFERRADEIALRLTRDPHTAVETFRRLALINLADLDPAPAVVLALYTHPPVRERIAAAIAAGSGGH